MTIDRDALRGQIARDGLADRAVEHVARTALGRMPITLVDRARVLLTRFFSEAPWTKDDDDTLADLVGAGEGWETVEIGPGTVVGFGWHDGRFSVGFVTPGGVELPVHPRTLGDTFEEALVIEMAHNQSELRFATGPGALRGIGRYTREKRGDVQAISDLFDDFPDIEMVRVGEGVINVIVRDASRWYWILLPLFDTINTHFVRPRAAPADRSAERAEREVGSLDPANPRELARLLDATTSPDAATRRIAMGKLEVADVLVVTKPWNRALDDSSRGVRRAAVRAAAYAGAHEHRELFERALYDSDACVRYYAVRGLHSIGSAPSREQLERRLRDPDIRVRIGVQATLEGRDPA